jgi:molybdopterin adenylyltransferase
MNIPEKLEILIITLSDRAYRGEYEDLSGPQVNQLLKEHFNSLSMKYSVTTVIIPDDSAELKKIIDDTSSKFNVIFTTGGTGIGPRDITVDTIRPMLLKEIPGIMEYIRVKYGDINSNALISRSVAGIIGISIIYTLPGSVKAVKEYMTEILKTLVHTINMQYGVDKHLGH